MLQEALKTEKGRLLLRHVTNCKKCYAQLEEVNKLPRDRHVKKLKEIVEFTHPDSVII